MNRWKYLAGAAMAAAVATGAAIAVSVGDGPASATVPPDSSGPGDDATAAGDGRTIVVSGHGAVTVTPDVADVWTGVQATAPTSQEAMDTLGEKSTALVDTLTAVGVAAEDIQTSGLNLWPQYGDDGVVINGYQASTNLTVRVREIARVGEIIDAAAGFVGEEFTLGGISFSYDDPESVLQEARVAAFENARTRAEQYADAAGVTVGEVVRIVEPTADPVVPYATEMAADSAGGGRVAIQPGTQDLTVDVTVVFAMA